MALAGTPEQAGTEPVHETVAAVVALSANLTSPPGAIVTLLAGAAYSPDPLVAQHGQLSSTQFSLTSSFASDGAAARAGSTATAAPSSAARAKSKSVRGLIVNPPFSCWMPPWQSLGAVRGAAASRLVIA